MSEIDSSLIQSYKATTYHVNIAGDRVEFFIGKFNPELDSILNQHDARTAAFITAHNPHSQIVSAAENACAHEMLLKELQATGYRWLAGYGTDPDREWPPETSILILAIDQPGATALATQLDQNAYVWIEAGTPPALILTQSNNLLPDI
jgi:hypothetical protein